MGGSWGDHELENNARIACYFSSKIIFYSPGFPGSRVQVCSALDPVCPGFALRSLSVWPSHCGTSRQPSGAALQLGVQSSEVFQCISVEASVFKLHVRVLQGY